MWTDLVNGIAIFCLFFGAFFILTAAVGIVRFKDTYTRLHAASKGSTFGFCFMVLGAALLLGGEDNFAKAILAIAFQFLTAPVGAHMIARVAIRKGLRPICNPQGDPVGSIDISGEQEAKEDAEYEEGESRQRPPLEES